MARLNRKKITVTKSAEILDVVPIKGWEVEVESGQPLDISFLYYFAGGRLIQKQLILFLRGQRKKRSVGNLIIRYLRFVSETSRVVDSKSMLEYKRHIDSTVVASVNSKYQIYSAAAGFVKHLMSSGVIAHEQLPKNFIYIKSKLTPSVFELAASEMQSYATENSLAIKQFQKKQGLDFDQALILRYGNDVLDAFHNGALKKIKAWESDCNKVEKILLMYQKNELLVLGRVSDFREAQGNWKSDILPSRTIEGAIAILYAHFGRLLPSSANWPLGIVDFLKLRGWSTSRLGAALFNNSSNIQYFLVAALTHRDLAPNVDSVAFYSYLDSFEKGDEIGVVNVFLGKKRGAPVNVSLRANDPLCEVFMSFQKRQRRILSEIPGGSNWLKKERCELFIIYSAARGNPYYLKLIDATSTVDMVRYAARELSIEYSILKPLIKKITGKAFRSTIVAMDVAEGRSLGQIKEKLNHEQLSTTASYAVRIETQSFLELKLRKFHDYLLNTREESMERTGTGYFCGIKEEKDVFCKGVDLCFNCEAKRLVLKDSQSISEWLAWAEKIKNNMKRLKFNNPERWDNYWKFKLAEYESLLSLCTRAEVDRAKELAIKIEEYLPHLD